MPVPSPGAGVIEERYVEDGTSVKAGQKLFKIKLGKCNLINTFHIVSVYVLTYTQLYFLLPNHIDQ